MNLKALATVAAAGIITAGGVYTANLNQAATSTGAMRVYNSGNDSEQVTSIPISPTYPYPKANPYCIDLGTPPQVGETILAIGEVEVTNDVRYKVYWNTQLVLGDSCDTNVGTEITEANGYNLLYDVHHGTASRTGTLVITSPTSRRFVVMQSYAKALNGSPWEPGDSLTVEPDFGRLAVLRWTP